ncbi:uncharacterized protein N7515_007261 [Penicillium bovifimosum]|uniref:Uncharacterized protein n=1 Tax=Penicillium bovifimosum TaxID=126998 RepID=A0A9W9L218_9EURO|nr:uncharacterized protein N7515_007261 [Penicillium bovifimosum]KAJ5131222.1 hypothetical protein N7515_007261 [Penicillium bovifimosum]
MPRSVQHWPGGIPRCIKPHPQTEITLDQAAEEVKGWLLFVQENWVPGANASDGTYELNQRRQLIEKWASATQEFRDSYQSRAPTSSYCQYPAEALSHIDDTLQTLKLGRTTCRYQPGLVSTVPVDEAHAANRERWVKLAILFYNYEMVTGHCLDDNYMPSEAILNPEITTNPSIEDFLSWKYLETANFLIIGLTHTGTVLNIGCHPYVLVDEEGLRTGRLTLVNYDVNGTVKESLHIRPFNMRRPYSHAMMDFDKILDRVDGAYTHQNLPLDMGLPIIDILCQAKAADQLSKAMKSSYREKWVEDVELYAPGYLALEAEGRAGEYSLDRLTLPDPDTRSDFNLAL